MGISLRGSDACLGLAWVAAFVSPSAPGRQRSQSLMEFALVAPIVVLIAFGTIDLGRLIYTYGAISSAAQDGSRLLTLSSQQYSDCAAMQRMETVGQGFPLVPDPTSVYGDGDPNVAGNGQVPPASTGYIYIYPAVASASPPDQNPTCANGLARPFTSTIHDVAVQTSYNFMPITPVIAAIVPNGFTVRIVAVCKAQY